MLPGHRLSTLSLKSVALSDRFWLGCQQAMSSAGLMHQWKMCEDTGRIENLRRCARGDAGEYAGKRFNDSDVYKLMEACAYALSVNSDHPVKAKMEAVIDVIAEAQMDDGYLNSYVQVMIPEHRWRNLNGMHEMYCAGHLIEAGVAYYSATGERKLMDVGVRFADHVMSIFGPGKKLGYPGHQELELALVRLAGATGEQKYAEFAKWLTQARGTRPSPFEKELADSEVSGLLDGVAPLYIKNGKYDGAYAQDDVPLARQDRAVGHSVRAMYYYCGAVDCLGDDPPTMDAVKKIWDGLVSKQMYVTGGIGSSHRNEGFTIDYDLPNVDAYAETCAAIGLVFWGWRMYLLTGDTKYVDTLERALYNAVMSGVSADGKRYFYENPLESDGRHSRKPWYECACCPPNIARLVMSIGQYAVAASDCEISVAMPLAGRYETDCGTLSIKSNYPWGGSYILTVEKADGLKRVSLRRPEWADGIAIEVNGESTDSLSIDREWKDGDTVRVAVGMPAQWVESHPDVLTNAGRVALQRGPVVFSLEEHDLGAAPHLWSADTTQAVKTVEDSALGTVNLIAEGSLGHTSESALYSPAGEMQREPKSATFVPNYTWANRGANSMIVWVLRES